MVKTLMFVYTMILFLSLFIVAKKVDAQLRCKFDIDCSRVENLYPMIYRCIYKM
ncbi:unnamed protein product [Trifolium pratense]|uniref:Uncharacterized protein n=1 Tax=Trifolium pratense TaxID=57577 RepID=A0ACB0IXJ6_TRIPR|nr:unnamed protein product [Trifolium pratense]